MLPPPRNANVPESLNWSYSPNPATVVPPVPHETMLHWYYDPSCCAESRYCLDRLPKSLTEDPIADEVTGDAISWGIELVEGRDFANLWIIGMIIVALSSFVGGFWALYKHEVQAGFNIACFMIAAFSCMVGTLQVALDRT